MAAASSGSSEVTDDYILDPAGGNGDAGSVPCSTRVITRRRFIGIAASVGGMALLPSLERTCRRSRPAHLARRGAWAPMPACNSIIPIRRSRAPDPPVPGGSRPSGTAVQPLSSRQPLVRLNRTGELADPPMDMVRLLSEAARFSRLTDGAFDVTVQPLWRLYAEHFPAPAPIRRVRRRRRSRRCVPWSITGRSDRRDRISFARRGMAVTLNGIAQGYITDRVADRLRAEGMTNVLVDMGEVLALGGHPDGRPWRVGLRDKDNDTTSAGILDITDAPWRHRQIRATRFDRRGRFGHISTRGRPQSSEICRNRKGLRCDNRRRSLHRTDCHVRGAGESPLSGTPGVTCRSRERTEQ